MKLIHVVPHISAEASGPSYSVPRLCQAIAAHGHEVTLSCLAAERAIPGVRTEVYPSWPILRGFAVSHRHALALRKDSGQVDIVHNHSLWSMVNVGAGWVVPGSRAKLVASPRGTLSPWALARRRDVKRLLWPLQRRVIARADLLHATSEDEYAEIRARGFAAPVVVIPNGIDLPDLPPDRAGKPERTLLFLGRLHPKKGIDRLMQAWQRLQDDHPDWRLSVVGRGEPAHLLQKIVAQRAAKGKSGRRHAAVFDTANIGTGPVIAAVFGDVLDTARSDRFPRGDGRRSYRS